MRLPVSTVQCSRQAGRKAERHRSEKVLEGYNRFMRGREGVCQEEE